MNKEKLRTIDILMLITMAGMLICLVIGGILMYNLSEAVDEVVVKVGADAIVDISDLKNATGAVELKGTKLSEAISLLTTGTDSLLHSNAYITCAESEDSNTTLIYNKNGESISQDSSGNITVYRDDNDAIYFGESITYGTDCDAVKCLNIAARAAKDGFGVVSEIDMSDKGETLKEYTIDISGYDNIQKMYGYIEENFAKDMVESLKSSIAEGDLNDGEDTSYLNLRLVYVFDGEELASGGCYIYFGEGTIGYWDNCYTTWYFDGYYKVGDWKLDDEWYSYDYDKVSEDEGKHITEMLDTLYNDVTTMLAEYQSDDATTGNLELPDSDLIDNGNSDSSGASDVPDASESGSGNQEN